jgi:hypothetical protein
MGKNDLLLIAGLFILGSGTLTSLFKKKETSEYPIYPQVTGTVIINEQGQQQIKDIETASVVTAEMIQPFQPFQTAPIVTTTKLYTYYANEWTSGRYRYSVDGMSNIAQAGDKISLIMSFRDEMRVNGYGLGVIHFTYLDGTTEDVQVQA